MKFVQFVIAYSLIWFLSKLPPRMLYACSDVLALILYYLVPYRKKTVRLNLSRSFPEKSEREINTLIRNFYRFFCDMSLESLICFHWSYERLAKRYTVKNPELIQEYFERNRNIMLVFGHYANWEWFASTFVRVCPHTVLIAYKPLHNEYFNRWIKKARHSDYAVYIIPEMTFRTILEHEQKGIPYLSIVIADQRPMPDGIQHWTTFMNQDTPVFLGPEKIARRTGQAVVFMNVRRLKRGRYQVEFVTLTDRPGETGQYEITERYFDMLEELIREQPELYLWSHKRWKYTREDIEQRKALQEAS